tara:strand:+ start:440 stop:1336 length:897 start_codon:yes stop_codon:yes gene_type:complete
LLLVLACTVGLSLPTAGHTPLPTANIVLYGSSPTGERAMSNLTQAVLEQDPDARQLASAMGESALHELAPLLEHDDPLVRMRAVMALGGIDILTSRTALFKALDDPDFNVMQTALSEIERQQHKLSVDLLTGLLEKLQDINARNRIILILGQRLSINQTAALDKYCNVQQPPDVVLHCMAALARIGVEQRRQQFSSYLIKAQQDHDALQDVFQLVEYINQPWLVASLRQLLTNKSPFRALQNPVANFPDETRVCDEAVLLIGRLLPSLSLSFDTSLYTNFSDEQIAELNYAASQYKYE